mmetsp:Transcript_183171/g.580728  ORF Transcript_183171/g.580728 Transcript_183171/m.580728 type:complete len:211 (+) Transcript_183171:329-961(+)
MLAQKGQQTGGFRTSPGPPHEHEVTTLISPKSIMQPVCSELACGGLTSYRRVRLNERQAAHCRPGVPCKKVAHMRILHALVLLDSPPDVARPVVNHELLGPYVVHLVLDPQGSLGLRRQVHDAGEEVYLQAMFHEAVHFLEHEFAQRLVLRYELDTLNEQVHLGPHVGQLFVTTSSSASEDDGMCLRDDLLEIAPGLTHEGTHGRKSWDE